MLAKGPLAKLQPQAAVEEGAELELKLVEVGLHDIESGVGKLNGLDIAVAGAAKLVGKKVKIRVERVLDGTAFATLAGAGKQAAAPITAEGLAEKPTRASRSRKVAEEPAAEVETEDVWTRSRRRSPRRPPRSPRRSPPRSPPRRRRRSGRAAARAAGATARRSPLPPLPLPRPTNGEVAETAATPKIHLPAADLGTAEQSADGDEAATERGAEEEAHAPRLPRRQAAPQAGRRRRQRRDG